MTDIRWVVFRDRFPFGSPEPIGEVHAADKAAAEVEARTLFGPPVLVQSSLSVAIGDRELNRPKLTRKSKANYARKHVRPTPAKKPALGASPGDFQRVKGIAHGPYARRSHPMDDTKRDAERGEA